MHLTVKQFCVYLRYIKRFETYEQLRAFEAAVYPYLSKEDREGLRRKYTRTIAAHVLISNSKDVEASWRLLRASA